MKKFLGSLIVAIIAPLVVWCIQSCPFIKDYVEPQTSKKTSNNNANGETIVINPTPPSSPTPPAPPELSDLIQIGEINYIDQQHTYFTAIITDDLTAISEGDEIFVIAKDGKPVGLKVAKRLGKKITTIYPHPEEFKIGTILYKPIK